ncbi:MAG TPA: hypothetical protein VE621_12380 [Bryobacteraceae bacterium]|nr:hypothetical protein [Bryobacteraceae bacterium]
MTALNAAGLTTNAGSPVNSQLRDVVLEHVREKNPPVLSQLRNFVEAHRRPDPGANIGQYMSFALSVTDPPEFESKYRPGDTPPDVQALEGFAGLMSKFHREAAIDELWKKVQPTLEQALTHSQPAVLKATSEANGYTRSFTSGYMGRRFQIFLDLLGAPGKTQTRSYAEDYYLVLSPAQDPPVQDIRHAYFHYLIDPLPYKFSAEVNKKKGMIDYAEGAPLLDQSYKSDFLLLVTECLIKAIEARLAPEADRARLVQTALSEGFVMTPFFAERLPVYEHQESALRLYFPDLISAMDLKKEAQRLDKVEFASKREVSKPATPAAAKAPTKGEELFVKGEELSAAKNYEQARETFLKVLELDEKALHPRAYFQLARIAVFQKSPGMAEKLFQKSLELHPDDVTRSWSEYYLGRLSDLAGDRETAIRYYRSVLANMNGAPAARREAEKALAASQNQD